MIRWLLVMAWMVSCVWGSGVALAADKYALLIGVTKYEHSGMSTLTYPEDDAKALGEMLQSGGYVVELLLGKDATQKAIREKLDSLRNKGTAEGVIVLGLFGHGVEVETRDGNVVTQDGCFCPVDTVMRIAKDSKGNDLYGTDKEKLTEPDPESLVKLSEVMSMFQLAKSGHRVLLADCCRVVPDQARGRSFGSSFKAASLPENTSVLFGCSPNEQVFEHSGWGHGAFTKCLLEQLPLMASQGQITTATLADRMKEQVPLLVQSVSPKVTLNPRPFITDSVDLQWVWKQEGEKLLMNTLGMKLKLIPSGEFLMGSSDADIDEILKLKPSLNASQFADEQPQHPVRITQPFYMGVYEVTKGEFAAFVKAQSYQTETERDGKGGVGLNEKGNYETKPEFTWKNTGFAQTDDYPVVNVSWNDAVAFCKWLSMKEGKSYHLPSEAQWEYACRAGTTTPFHFGSVNDGTKANINGNFPYGTETKGPFLHRTTRVGSYAGNAFGLYDMHGNAYEWCQDPYDARAYAARTGVTIDPLNITDQVVRRAQRSGSWCFNGRGSRSADRIGFWPADRGIGTGFRVSKTLVGLPILDQGF